MNRTETMLAQILKTLVEIRDEVRAANRISKKASDQQISESKAKQRQMRMQMMLVESQRRK